MFAPDSSVGRLLSKAPPAADAPAMRAQESAFLASLESAPFSPPAQVTPHRGPRQARGDGTFRNVPDTDPAVDEHRAWAQDIVATPPEVLLPRTPMLDSIDAVDAVVDKALRAQ